jgi:hypothetical protein
MSLKHFELELTFFKVDHISRLGTFELFLQFRTKCEDTELQTRIDGFSSVV